VIEPIEAATLIKITADDVVLRGLVLAHIVPSHVEDRAALKFERVRRCVVEDNEIRDAPVGIYVSESSDCFTRASTPAA
jgi:nitrous oxidase accessory protein NosD